MGLSNPLREGLPGRHEVLPAWARTSGKPAAHHQRRDGHRRRARHRVAGRPPRRTPNDSEGLYGYRKMAPTRARKSPESHLRRCTRRCDLEASIGSMFEGFRTTIPGKNCDRASDRWAATSPGWLRTGPASWAQLRQQLGSLPLGRLPLRRLSPTGRGVEPRIDQGPLTSSACFCG